MDEVTPLDVLGQTFSRRLRGLDPEQVQRFLAQVASTLERLLRERGEMRQRVRSLEQELAAFREREKALQDALIAAQRSAEDTVEEARNDGQRIVAEAQALGERLIQDANERAKTIETVIADLRSRRREVRAELMRLTELLQGLIRDDQQLENEERATPRLALLERRKSQTSKA